MNGAIARMVNDKYMIRCAQILNNKSHISSQHDFRKIENARNMIFVKADGITTSDGVVIPITDGFDTIAICKKGNVVSINLCGTDYTMNIAAREGNYCFKVKTLGIEFRETSNFLDKKYQVEKVFFEYKTPQKTLNTIYSIYDCDLLEPIYYFEEYRTDEDSEPIINTIINNKLFRQDDETILKHMIGLYNERENDVDPEKEKELLEAMTEYYKNNPIDLTSVPTTQSPKPIIEKSDESLSEKRLNLSIYASSFDFEEDGKLSVLKPCVRDMHDDLYNEAIQSGDTYILEDQDIFFRILDMSDGDFEDETLEESEEEEEQYTLNEEDFDEDNEELSDKEKAFLERFEFYTQDGKTNSLENISDFQKHRIVENIKDFLMQRDFEFIELYSLMEAMVGVVEDIENAISKVVEKSNNLNDDPSIDATNREIDL